MTERILGARSVVITARLAFRTIEEAQEAEAGGDCRDESAVVSNLAEAADSHQGVR
jgi:hypothetical protein